MHNAALLYSFKKPTRQSIRVLQPTLQTYNFSRWVSGSVNDAWSRTESQATRYVEDDEQDGFVTDDISLSGVTAVNPEYFRSGLSLFGNNRSATGGFSLTANNFLDNFLRNPNAGEEDEPMEEEEQRELKCDLNEVIPLLKHCNINARTPYGETPLLLVIKSDIEDEGKLRNVKTLLEHGADPNLAVSHLNRQVSARCRLIYPIRTTMAGLRFTLHCTVDYGG